MVPERNVTILPKIEQPKRVAIYCRVSSASREQIHSLINQISFLTVEVGSNPDFRIVGIYIDVHSGSSVAGRPEYNRMLQDCRCGEIDVVYAKSVSRFGRDSLEAMKAVQELVMEGVLVHFSEYDMSTEGAGGMLQFQVAATIAEDENRARSKNIIWAIKHQAEDGTSSLYRRKCYGYRSDGDGLVLVPEEAENVRLIFDLYLKGYSIVKILDELEKRGIKSPTGKERWCKRSIDTMLSNEKYTGDVMVLKTYSSGFPDNKRMKNLNVDPVHPMFKVENDHAPIITQKTFDAVQAEKLRRSNIIKDATGTHRSTKKYSAKKVGK